MATSHFRQEGSNIVFYDCWIWRWRLRESGSHKEVDNGFLEEEKGAATAVVCSVGSGQGETDRNYRTIWGGSFSKLAEEAEAVVVAACGSSEKVAALVSGMDDNSGI